MSRATPDDVRAITGSTASDEEIQPYLDVAHYLVNSVQPCYGDLEEEVLTQAEAYLAAHLMATTGQGGITVGAVSDEKIDSQSISYAISKTNGEGILQTGYGRIANMLLNGCLSNLDKAKSGICFTGGA